MSTTDNNNKVHIDDEIYVDDHVKMDPKKTIEMRLLPKDTKYCVWQIEKPNKPCVFVVENAGEYEIYQLDYVEGRLEWLDNYGNLWDDIEELDYKEYLIIKWLNEEQNKRESK
jgi:hypothetical protein